MDSWRPIRRGAGLGCKLADLWMPIPVGARWRAAVGQASGRYPGAADAGFPVHVKVLNYMVRFAGAAEAERDADALISAPKASAMPKIGSRKKNAE